MTILFCSVHHLGVSQSLRHRYFLVNFAEFFRTPFFTVTASILRCSATFNHSHKNGNLFRSYYYDLIDYLRAHLNSSESQLRSRGLDSFFPRKDDFLCLFRQEQVEAHSFLFKSSLRLFQECLNHGERKQNRIVIRKELTFDSLKKSLMLIWKNDRHKTDP